MFTERNVFSSSLTSSAASGDETGTIVSMQRRVERGRDLGAVRRDAADDLRRVLRVIDRIARVDALRAEREEDVFADGEAALVERGQRDLARRAGIGRAFEDDEHARVRLPRRGLGRGDAHSSCRDRASSTAASARRSRSRRLRCSRDLVGRRFELAAPHERRDFGRRNVLDVRLAGIQQIDDALADVVADDVETGLRELHRQRQADVAEPDDADDGGCGLRMRCEQLLLSWSLSPAIECSNRRDDFVELSWVSSGKIGSDKTSFAALSDSGQLPVL